MKEQCSYTEEEKKKYCLCETCRFTKQCFEDIDQILEEMEHEKTITNRKAEENA